MNDFIKFRTIAEWNAYFDSQDVAAKLAEKVSLEAQRIIRRKRRTPAELRMLDRIKSVIAEDRAAVGRG